MTASKKEGFLVNPFLKVPTLIATYTLRPSSSLAVISAQAGRSCPVSPGAVIGSPHWVICQTTPASGPMVLLNQRAKGRVGSASSRSEADTLCAEEIARLSNDPA